MLRRLTRPLRMIGALLRRQDGAATMEFVLVVPFLLAIFLASFESGLLMVRSIMLEQAVDRTMRELRLGHFPTVTNRVLKKEICARSLVFPDCVANMKIEMHRISTETFTMPDTPARCINRAEAAEPVVAMDAGQQNDLMLIRVCIHANAIFPTSGLALDMTLKDGAYGIITRSSFVVEPR